MAAYDNRHSRTVARLKVVLPLLALGILSTLFLLAPGRDGVGELPYSQGELDRLAAERRVTNPNYSAVTREGAAVSLTARSVTADPDRPDGMLADQVSGAIDLPGEGQLTIRALKAAIGPRTETVTLTGDVGLRTSTGYQLASEQLTTSLDVTRVSSDGPVAGVGPPGRLTAGRMELRQREDGAVLHFAGGVRLIYTPPPTDAAR